MGLWKKDMNLVPSSPSDFATYATNKVQDQFCVSYLVGPVRVELSIYVRAHHIDPISMAVPPKTAGKKMIRAYPRYLR